MWKWIQAAALAVVLASSAPACASMVPNIQKVEVVADKAQTAREEADLHAQEVAAWWTRAGVGVSLVGLLVSGIGLFLIWKQLRHGEAAVRESARSSQAATDAASAALLSSRPWLKISDMSAQFHQDEQPPVLSLWFFIENVGQTPAVMATTSAHLLATGKQDELDEAVKTSPDKHRTLRGATVFPGDRVRGALELQVEATEPWDWSVAVIANYRITGGATTHTSGAAFIIAVGPIEPPFSGPQGELIWDANVGANNQLRVDAT